MTRRQRWARRQAWRSREWHLRRREVRVRMVVIPWSVLVAGYFVRGVW